MNCADTSEKKDVKTQTNTLALVAAFSIPAFAQQLPTTGFVETRLGKLELIDGYPTEATAKKLYDDIDFQRACQAYIWALPAVGFEGLHLAHLNTFGAKDGDIVLYRDLKDKAGMLTSNITTIYTMSFWDIDKQGPLVAEVPPGLTAGGVLDIWQRPVTDIGQTGPDKGQGGKYLVLGPNSEDIKVEGYFVKRSPTNQLWFATRGLSPDAKAAGRRCANTSSTRGTSVRIRVWPGKHWEYANLVELNREAKGYGQLDERGSWFYEAIGNSAEMQGRILGFGQAYLETSKDKDGDWLAGDNNYRLHVPPNVPIKQFWSITLYDNVTRGPAITDQGASDLSSRKPISSPTPTARWMSI